jgi:hypothetical protein
MLRIPTPLIQDRSTVKTTKKQIADNIMARFQDAKNLRVFEEARWQESYSLWRNSNYDKDAMRSDAVQTAGTSSGWKHRVNTGKTFEVIETLVAYLKTATFPSDDWFEAIAKEPEMGDILDLVQKAVKYKLEEADIASHVELFMRYLLLFGTSTYRVTWESETERVTTRKVMPDGTTGTSTRNVSSEELCVEVMSPFDIWLTTDEEGIWCRLNLSQCDFLSLVDQGYYTVSTEAKLKYAPRKTTKVEQIPNGEETSPADQIIEFYGNVVIDGVVYKDIHAVFLGKELIRLGDSAYWCGSPYVPFTLFPDLGSPYGISMLHPNLGALHVTNVLTNLRLDNMLLHMHGMWEKVEDGVLDDEALEVKPGKVFKVAQKGNMSRLDMGPPTFTVTYQEAATQEAGIDRAMATGPLIGAGQPRGGDRVTAEEIVAVRDSGGNRLNLVHTRIEQLSTLPLLAKAFKLVQQYQTDDVLISVFDEEQQQLAYYPVPNEAFNLPLEMRPIGANFVIETSRNISNLLQVMDISARSPELAARLDQEAILLEVMKQLRVDKPQRFIKPLPAPIQTADPSLPAMPEEPGMGEIAQNAMTQQIATDGGASVMDAAGIPTEGVPTDQLQQIMLEATQNV